MRWASGREGGCDVFHVEREREGHGEVEAMLLRSTSSLMLSSLCPSPSISSTGDSHTSSPSSLHSKVGDVKSTNVPGCISKLDAEPVGEGKGVVGRIEEDTEPRSRPRRLDCLHGLPKGQGSVSGIVLNGSVNGGLAGGVGSCAVEVFDIGSMATLLLRR